MGKQEQILKEKLASISSTDAKDWFIVSRARHGMEQVFRQVFSLKGSGQVITQSFTCVTAINPIIASGLTPVYCDISANNFSIDVEKLNPLVSQETRAVIMQHSFGIPADVASAKKRLGSSNVLIIEDSAHRLGYITKKDKIPLADVSVHSFGSEKFLKTNFGGAIWVNPEMHDKELRNLIINCLSNLPKVSLRIRLKVWLYPSINGVLNRLPATISKLCRKILLVSGLFRSPIVPKEQRGTNYEPCQSPNERQLRIINDALAGYYDNLSHRLELTALYQQLLQDSTLGLETVKIADISEMPLVRFPLLANTREIASQIFDELRQKGINVGKWYRPLFFPGVNNLKQYYYEIGSCPVAEDLSVRIINLPTNQQTTVQQAKELIDAIKSN